MSMVNYTVDGELYHHGIKGQRWGDRNYQYEDGSLTPEGRRRYYGSAGQNRFRFGDAKSKPKTKEEKEMAKANSAYRVERHKAKMERKTQEAINKERIKKEQSNAKRNAIISKLKGNKPSAQVKKVDSEGEEKRNDKKFEKNVKELLTAKNIKDYSKYTKEELEEAASRKEAANRMDAERRKSTKFGRAQEFFNSPAGQTILNTATKEAISGLSDIAESWGKEAISKYLDKNAKEMYERSVDREGWEAKRAATVGKLLSEASQSRANAEKAWKQAEGEKLKNDSQRLSNQGQSIKNKQLKADIDRDNAEYEARANVRKASNKAEEEKFKSEADAYKAERAKSKTTMAKEKTKQSKEQTKQEEETSKQLGIKVDRKNHNDIGMTYRNTITNKIVGEQQRDKLRGQAMVSAVNVALTNIQNRQSTQTISNDLMGQNINQININAKDLDIELLMKIINSRN